MPRVHEYDDIDLGEATQVDPHVVAVLCNVLVMFQSSSSADIFDIGAGEVGKPVDNHGLGQLARAVAS